MKSHHHFKRVPLAAAFILTLAVQSAFADHHEGDHADKNNNVDNAYQVKDGHDGLTSADKPVRKLDSKQSSRKRSGTTKSGGNADSSTIGKGTGNPESTEPGSGTGYSGGDK